MKKENYIEFRRTRSLGDIISDTLGFIRSEFNSFFGTIIKAAIFPITIAIGATLYYLTSFSAVVTDTSEFYEDEIHYTIGLENFFLPLLAFLGAYLLAYALISASALSYIKSYIEGRGRVNFENVSKETKSKTGPFIGLNILNGLVIGIGMLFCFLPGIYFWVVLSMSSGILIFQGRGAIGAFEDSFSFIKGYWWEAFGNLLVIVILIFITNFIINIPITYYQFGNLGFDIFSSDTTEVVDIFSDPVYLILQVVTYIVQFIFYIIQLVATVFIYFDISERKNPSSLKSDIDMIGSSE